MLALTVPARETANDSLLLPRPDQDAGAGAWFATNFVIAGEGSVVHTGRGRRDVWEGKGRYHHGLRCASLLLPARALSTNHHHHSRPHRDRTGLDGLNFPCEVQTFDTTMLVPIHTHRWYGRASMVFGSLRDVLRLCETGKNGSIRASPGLSASWAYQVMDRSVRQYCGKQG